MGNSSGVSFTKVLGILFIVFGIIGIFLIGFLIWKGYNAQFNPTNTTVTNQNPTIINNNTTNVVKVDQPLWQKVLNWAVFILLLLALAFILYLLLYKQQKKPIDIWTRAAEMLPVLVEMNYPFKTRIHNNKRTRLMSSMLDKNINVRKRQVKAYVLANSFPHHFAQNYEFKRWVIRFWMEPKFIEHKTPDWEPPISETIAISVSAYGKPEDSLDILGHLTGKECREEMRKESYGLSTSPEPFEKASLLNAKLEDSMREQANAQLTKQLGETSARNTTQGASP